MQKNITAFLIILVLLFAATTTYLIVKIKQVPVKPAMVSVPTDNNENQLSSQSSGNSGKIDLNEIYWKDQNNVYYQYSYQTSNAYPPIKIEGADVNSFQALASDYAKDKNSVYHDYSKIDADSSTFQVLDSYNGWSNWAKDKNGAFFSGLPVDGADLESLNIINDYWAKDKNSVYNNGVKIEQADVATFQTFSDSQYAKDKSFVYSGNGSEKLNMDSSTFKILSDKYLEDKNGIYYLRSLQDGFKLLSLSRADKDSFQALGNDFGKDKNHAYFEDRVIGGADIETFHMTNAGKPEDKYNSYECFDSDCSFGCDVIDLKTGQKTNNSFGQNSCQ